MFLLQNYIVVQRSLAVLLNVPAECEHGYHHVCVVVTKGTNLPFINSTGKFLTLYHVKLFKMGH